MLEFTPKTLLFIWLLLLIILVIIELLTVGLTTIWFAAGALAAAAVNLLGGPLWLQIAVFIALSCLLLLLTRPWAMRYLNSNRIRTNYEGVIGKVVRITEKTDNLSQTGKTIVNGQEWTVRTEDDREILEEGTLAKVVSISGVKLIVKRYEEE